MQIFTTGALCEPVRWTNHATGEKVWIWCVSEFVDDSYMNGCCIDPNENADTIKGLINPPE